MTVHYASPSDYLSAIRDDGRFWGDHSDYYRFGPNFHVCHQPPVLRVDSTQARRIRLGLFVAGW